MFEIRQCAAGCGAAAITGAELCALHCADCTGESRRIAEFIADKSVIHDLSAAGLRFVERDFSERAFYGANFTRAQFERCSFHHSTLRMVFFDGARFTDCDFSACDGKFVSFGGCTITNCSFENAEMPHFNFSGGFISNSSFNHSDLYNSRFNGTRFSCVNFVDCNVKKVLFLDADVRPDDGALRHNVLFKLSNTAEAVFDVERE
jgi:uncharacterized protein YjbI with pentapeptide repeats